jgi:hypothetical protein
MRLNALAPSLGRERLTHSFALEGVMSKTLRVVLPMILAASMAACAGTLRSPHIADLRENPGRYQDHTVNIEGVVTTSWGVPLVPFRLYKVDDGTGEVTILSQSSHMPTKGARVKVRGKVSDVGVLGGTALGLHLREEHLSVRR